VAIKMARIFFRSILELTCVISSRPVNEQVSRGIRFHPVTDSLIPVHTKKLLREIPLFPRRLSFVLIAFYTAAHDILREVWAAF